VTIPGLQRTIPLRFMLRCARDTAWGLWPFLSPPEDCARPLKLRGRVDAERHAVDDGRVDAHARFERAQLLEFFASAARRKA